MSKEYSRTERVSDLIQKELSWIIQHDMNDPRIGMLTLSEVVVSKDLAQAKIYFNILDAAKGKDTAKTLNKASGFLRQALAKRIKIRMTPALTFYYDDTLLRANKIEKLIDEAINSDQNIDNKTDD